MLDFAKLVSTCGALSGVPAVAQIKAAKLIAAQEDAVAGFGSCIASAENQVRSGNRSLQYEHGAWTITLVPGKAGFVTCGIRTSVDLNNLNREAINRRLDDGGFVYDCVESLNTWVFEIQEVH